MRILAVLALSLACPAAALALVSDDSDFSKPALSAQSASLLSREGRRVSGARVFALESSGSSRLPVQPNVVTGRIVLSDRDGTPRPARLARVRVGDGAWSPVGEDGSFSLGASGSVRVRVSFDNARWTFRSDNDDAYEWESGPIAAGTDAGALSPVAGSENAKLGVLHLTYLGALDFLSREATVSWWKEPLAVVWPGGSDYFSGWSLHLTDPLAWDVVLHEFGHAVMYGSMDVHGAGGSHKIDECYSEALAWSEGWASFFAGAVRLSPDDADAKFEFMVPRRKPIRLENVPDDVCQGAASEWRVFAGLWDLYDRHEDGLDKAALGFGPIWKGVTSGTTGSVLDAWNLVSSGLDPAARRAGEDALTQNTLLPARADVARLPVLPKSSAALFDGK